jgi:hypothetical protein
MSAANNPVRAALWRDLSEAAKRWAASPKAEEGQALSDAAKAWAGSAHPKATDTTASDATIPFGRSKGTRVVDAETKDLQWVAGALKQSLADPAKERFAPANRALLDAIEHELEGR